MPLHWYHLDDIPRWGIQRYQKNKYPGSEPIIWEPSHTEVYLYKKDIFEVTAPRARIGEHLFEENWRYAISRYADCNLAEDTTLIEKQYFCQPAWSLNGTMYDYGQLIDIAIRQQLGWIPKDLSIFDLGRKLKVCSVGVLACYLKWWIWWGWYNQNNRRPIKGTRLEDCCPADFIAHDTFKLIAELIPDSDIIV